MILDTQVRQLWAQTRLKVWPERYYLVSLPLAALPVFADLFTQLAKVGTNNFSAVVIEQDEISLTISEIVWRSVADRLDYAAVSSAYKVITLNINLDLAVVGYLAPAATQLAQAGISIVPQCAYLKDHLLIRETDLEQAQAVLIALIQTCQAI